MQLIFVYNANSGKLNALYDAAHKLLSPATYPCSLCALTYNTVSEKRIWQDFKNTHGVEMIFLHKDEFELQFPDQKIEYPAVLKRSVTSFASILNPSELNNIPNVEELIKRLKSLT